MADKPVAENVSIDVISSPVTTEQVPAPGGAPVRRYLNDKITPTLLEGMRMIAKTQPDKPLQTLGNYLIEQSKILEEQENAS